MKKYIPNIIFLATALFLSVFITLNCGDSGSDNNAAASTKDLLTFAFTEAANPALSEDVTGTISGASVTAVVPYNTVVTSLIASFTTNAASIAVNGVEQESGVTANDFSNTVTYTLTAEDGSAQDYAVTVTVRDITKKNLLTFVFTEAANPALSEDVTGTISGTSVAAEVLYNTDVTSLIASFTKNAVSVKVNGVEQESGVTANDFSSAVTYTLAVLDGSTKDYIVTVSKTVYVDAVSGSDSNDGSSGAPFKTITYAAASTGTNVSIKVNPGTYDAANGETFPINLLEGQELVGDIDNKGNGTDATLIVGDGASPDGYTATIIGAEDAVVTGFKIEDDAYNVGYSGIYIADITMEVSYNTFAGYKGVNISGSGDSTIQGNIFNNSSYGVKTDICTGSLLISNNTLNSASLPIDILSATSGTVVSGNTIIGSGQLGIFTRSGNPQIIGNTFNKSTGYTNGAIYCYGSTEPLIRDNIFICSLAVLLAYNSGSPAPDLGTSGDPGGNDFSAVTGHSIQIESGVATSEIYAIGNTFPNEPPTTDDIYNQGSGVVYYTGNDFY